MLLVDTSIWIEFFRRGKELYWYDPFLDRLKADDVGVIRPVLTELLIGARSKAEQQAVVDLSLSLMICGITTESWMEAGELGRLWRSRGRTLSVTDCLLATEARRAKAPLFTLDRDFDVLFDEGSIQRPTFFEG